jgi:hypothetical protein
MEHVITIIIIIIIIIIDSNKLERIKRKFLQPFVI